MQIIKFEIENESLGFFPFKPYLVQNRINNALNQIFKKDYVLGQYRIEELLHNNAQNKYRKPNYKFIVYKNLLLE